MSTTTDDGWRGSACDGGAGARVLAPASEHGRTTDDDRSRRNALLEHLRALERERLRVAGDMSHDRASRLATLDAEIMLREVELRAPPDE